MLTALRSNGAGARPPTRKIVALRFSTQHTEYYLVTTRGPVIARTTEVRKEGRDNMSDTFDFVVVGGGSAGAVIASRLSEDPSCQVALIEAGERPPEVSLMPVACEAMQKNPAIDWTYTADPGKARLGLVGRRMPVPRGKIHDDDVSIQ
jgi:GMC oxidoreductase